MTELGLPTWAIDFCNQTLDELFDVIVAANYLQLPAILDVALGKVATIVKSLKTNDEIRATFGIKNDLTPEQEKYIEEETRWCEEA